MIKVRPSVACLAALALFPGLHLKAAPVPDHPFPQEVTRRVKLPDAEAATRSQLIDVSDAKAPRVFAGGRWWRIQDGKGEEIPALKPASAEEFTFPGTDGRPIRVPVPWGEVRQWIPGPAVHWIATRKDPWRVVDGRAETVGWPSRWEVRQVAVAPDGTLWVASSGGLFRQVAGGWQPVDVKDALGRRWAVSDVLGVAFDGQGRPWVATPAGVAVGEGQEWRFFEGKDGLPDNDFTGVSAAPDGAVWFGTKRGAIRFDGTDWSYRQGPRWLPNDEVRNIVTDASQTTWFATAGGVGGIQRVPMTLAAKAAFYEDEIEKYIKRTEFGYTSEVGLSEPGDRSKIHYSDSDNDGLWTGMYGAGECFAYAATRKPEFKDRARKAFEALRFLQKVTQGGPHSPPKGFVARTIRPADWPDPNVGRLESDRRERASGDRLWKVYEPRWPKSADGKWFWKSDTSSDELDGHYFFYARYYDLVADDAEKARVREVVRDLTDHLVAHDFSLVDHDGTPTRWGVFGPKYLNQDPNWWVERGLNSLSIVSYLAVAEHMTGDRKYAEAARTLIEAHGYGPNITHPKTQFGVGSGNQSDDEMAFMCFYNLMSYSRDPQWREKWLFAFHAYAALELPEMNPFFNFAYAPFGKGQKFSNPWGDFPVDPWDGWLEDSLATLRGFPLDRVNWPHRNSHRLDLVSLPPQQSTDMYEPGRRGRGHRVNGKVIPVAERHFGHWNTDPWRLDYGGDGRELASGVVFLLPYYLGLHHGFIAVPEGPP
ncbi:MAG: hypothetical protein JNK85_03680 [Verrucomicrobiales bacterium]|nr:hypothetical protein [Verrucomicrobiales bacterium]